MSDAHSVECPVCGADPGIPCTPGGKERPHLSRQLKATGLPTAKQLLAKTIDMALAQAAGLQQWNVYDILLRADEQLKETPNGGEVCSDGQQGRTTPTVQKSSS